MKNLNLIKTITAIFLFSLSILSCDKIKDLVSIDFNYTYSDLIFTIPAVDSGEVTVLSSMYFNADSMIKAQNSQLSVNNLKALYVKSCILNIESSSVGQDFSAIESCQLSVYTSTATTPVLIADLPNNPNTTSTTLTIPVNSTQDLSSLVKNNTTLNYKISIKTRKKVTAETKCKGTIQFNIKAGL